jgi:flagellar biosynthetic protein FliR
MNELLNFAWKDILSFLLIFVRVGVVFSQIPLFSAELIPRRITAIVAFFLSLVMLPVVPPSLVDMSNLNVLTLLVLLFHELLVGLTLALSVSLIFAGVQIAGELVGFQMGLAIVNVVDPVTGVDAPITANLLYIFAFLLFLSLGGHHMLINAMVESFTLVPIQSSLPGQAFLSGVLAYAAQTFVIGIKVSAPVIGVLLLINISFAITARAIPQMNVFMMSFPLTIAVGLFFLLVVLKMMPEFVGTALDDAWKFLRMIMPRF